MEFFHFPLVLSPEQEHELKKEYTLFSDALEKQSRLPTDYVNGLVARLGLVLSKLQITDYDRFRQQSDVQHHLAHFTHRDYNILNLPWGLAVGEAEHLFFSRGAELRGKNELPVFIPVTEAPLRILVMIAAPETDGEQGRLRYEDEQMQIAEAFGPLLRSGDIEIHFTADGSESALRQALQAPRYDIFHFSGHSAYDVVDWTNLRTEGFLLLEDELSMQPRRFSATDFATLLNERPEKRPALVFLSSCQSAQGDSGSGFTGITGHLIEAGIPGIMAMSHSVSDLFATLFTALFYQHIAAGLNVPLAFTKALKISRKGNGQAGYPSEFWTAQALIPQLYLTENIELLNKPASARVSPKRRGSGNFWQTGRLREKLQKMHRFAGREGEDFIFIGRRREQKAIRRHLEETAPVFLQGQGGMGKTALAVQTAERLVLADPDEVQVFMFDENTFRIGQVTDELLHFLKNEQKQILLAHQIKNIDKAWEQFLTALQEIINRCKPVFIFDNLESFQPEGGGDFLPEYSLEWEIITNLAALGLPLILTGRYPLPALPGVCTVPLHEPTRPDFAVKCRYLPISEKIPPGAEGKPVFELLFGSFGGNYRALEFFDTFYRQKKDAFGEVMESLHDFMQTHRAQPELLAQMSENLVFGRLLGLLTAAERKVLALLAHFRRPVLPLAVELQDPTMLDMTAALEHLSELTLTEKSIGNIGLNFFYVPTLTRLLLEHSGILINKLDDQRAGDYYDYSAEYVNNLVEEDGEAFFHYIRAENVEKVNIVGERLTGFLYNNSQFQNALSTAELALKINGDQTTGKLLNWLGLIFDLFGQYDNALLFFGKKMEKDREVGDLSGESIGLNNIGIIYINKGEYDAALQCLEKSLKIQQDSGRIPEGRIFNNISQIYMARSEYDMALQYLEMGLKIHQENGDLAGKCTILSNIAAIEQIKGDYKKALEHLKQALKISQDSADKVGEGAILNNISQVYSNIGDYDSSLQYIKQSLIIRQAVGDRTGEAVTLINIGHIYYAKDDYDTTLGYLEQSLQITQTVGDLTNEGIVHDNLGQVYKAKGDYNKALKSLNQGLGIRQKIGDKIGEGTSLNNLGQLYDAKGDYDTGLNFYKQSLKIRQSIGDVEGIATTLNNIGGMFVEQNRHEEAIQFLVQAYQIFQNIGSPGTEAASSWLNKIKEQIGAAKFQIIIAAMQKK